MATTQLSKSGIAMKKSRSDPQKYLNERRREVLRYVEKKGSFPIAQNWRKYGFTVQEIVERIRKGGHEPNWEKLPIEFRVDENGIPLPDQFCVETATSSTGSEGTRVAMNIASSGRAVADMVRHNERVIEEMEDFVRDLPPEETLLASDADNYREFRRIMDENRGQQVNINPEAIWNLETINAYLHQKDDRGRLRVKTGDAKNAKFEESTVDQYVGKVGKPFSGAMNIVITRYSRLDCRADVRECYKDMKNLLANVRNDIDGKTGKKVSVLVSADAKLQYTQALYFVAHHFKKDRDNEGALEKLYPDQMDILEEERQKYIKIRDASIKARKNIAIEAWASIKQKWLNDGDRLDIENVFFELYEESVGRDDFGRVFINPKVNVESNLWGFGGNNFMTKDPNTGDWTFHLNKYKTYKKYKSVKIFWRGEKAKLIDDWLAKSGNKTFLFEKNTNLRTRKPTAYGKMSILIGKKLLRIGVVNKKKGQNINYLRHAYASTFDWGLFRGTNKTKEDISYTMLHSPSMNAEYVRPLVDITESIRGTEREELEEEDVQDSNFVIPDESIPDYIPVSSRTRSRVRQREETGSDTKRRKRKGA